MQALYYRSSYAGAFPTLPSGMQRGQVEALLIEVARGIGLSGRRLQSLLFMIGQTRPGDWTSSEDEPVCYMAQTELAAALGKTERAVRADEHALSQVLGLVEKRTAANGGRSRHGGLGLVFSRLVERVPELLALRDRMRADRQRTKELVRLRSAYYRHIRHNLMELHPAAPEDPTLCAVRDAFLSWPPSERLRYLAMDDLEEHVAEARALCGELDRYVEESDDSSGGPEEIFRSHIQDTTNEASGSCNAAAWIRTSGKPSDTYQSDAEPKGPASCLENKHASSGAEHNSEFLAKLSPQRLLALCSENMQLRLEIETRGERPPMVMDFVSAAIRALPELGINHSAWDEAAEEMGDYRAALCVIITDANLDHPRTPVRNPGGHLRAMTRRHRQGGLNLIGSLIGLADRRRDV
ncbi:MAG: replication initiation protein RepC [Albidovulum sp.]|uniref:replication initiation protein RepC n=1 Tax=Albidovulum sp. TaxID=1872424 RepID=UPI003CB181EA